MCLFLMRKIKKRKKTEAKATKATEPPSPLCQGGIKTLKNNKMPDIPQNTDQILIVDFGGQYAHLIASRIRRMGVFSFIVEPEEAYEVAKKSEIKGIILSGGPQSVYDEASPQVDVGIFDLGKPVLGICYGHQFMAKALGGKVAAGEVKEYGAAAFSPDLSCQLFKNLPEKSTMWMSHGDEVTTLPDGFAFSGKTPSCAHAAMCHAGKNLFGIQFHPEVTHSEHGETLLQNFVTICAAQKSWTLENYRKTHEATLKKQIGERKVFLFVSGGVDSTVCFAWLTKMLGADRVRGVFVDTGLLRQGEGDWVQENLKNIGAELVRLNEGERFMKNLEGKTDPEEKRMIIGNTFIEIQKDYFKENKLGDDWVLAQGTIYPDTIETGATKNSSKIKTHHNRVPEIEKLIAEGKVVEPVADLYKDEVRELGELLGLDHDLVWRHPFPGPGLGVRILCAKTDKTNSKTAEFTQLPIKSVGVQGDFRTFRHPALIMHWQDPKSAEIHATKLINQHQNINRGVIGLAFKEKDSWQTVTKKTATMTVDRVAILQQCDQIVSAALRKMKLYNRVWQFPVVLAPLVFGSAGSESIILRPVESTDAMSARPGDLPMAFYDLVADKILKSVPEVSAVLLDVTTKPPGTIEWE